MCQYQTGNPCLFDHDALSLIPESERRAVISSNTFSVDTIILAGTLGILLGLIFLLVFFYRRLRFIARRISRKPASVPGPVASFRNLLFIFLWTAVFGMIFFAGFFFQAYYAFNREEPVAKVTITPFPQGQKNLVTLELFEPKDNHEIRHFEVSGDQWMLEGDILKWNKWINFLGIHTRYRLTRLRGRYIRTSDEQAKPTEIYSLVEIENHPIWGYLYRHGASLPFVSTVYGNAVFQNSEEASTFLIYTTTSGFMARKIEER